MASSGTHYGSTSNSNVNFYLTWRAVQNIAQNYTDLTIKLYYYSNSGTFSGTWSGGVKINTTTKTGTKLITLSSGSATHSVVYEQLFRIQHDDQGYARPRIEVTGGSISGTNVTWSKLTGDFAYISLDTIPRPTKPTLPNPYFNSYRIGSGTPLTVNLNPNVQGLRHDVTLSLGTDSETISTSGTSVSFNPPSNWIYQFPDNSSTKTGTVRVTTYYNSTNLGTESLLITFFCTYSLQLDSLSITEATEGIAEKFGFFIQNKSALNISFTGSGNYGSYLLSGSLAQIVDGINDTIYEYTNKSFISDIIAVSPSVELILELEDSRHLTDFVRETINIVSYNPPTISSFKAERVNNSGTPSSDGEFIAVSFSGLIDSLRNKNDKNYRINYKKDSDTIWNQLKQGTLSSYNYNVSSMAITDYGKDVFDPDYSYDIQVEVYDYFETITYQFRLPTSFTLMDFRNTGKGIAFGKASEADKFECALDAEFSGDFALTQPLPISEGGTGATTAAGALNNLGAGCINTLIANNGSASVNAGEVTNLKTITIPSTGTWLLLGGLYGTGTYIEGCFNTTNAMNYTWGNRVAASSAVWFGTSWFYHKAFSANETVRLVAKASTAGNLMWRYIGIKLTN